MDPTQAKQQIVERVRQATNILVTVSANPTVDQLAACIGLTLLLNKMEKHATAVFSGQVPSTIEFLQPEKTLETNTDSLRDFIISLDKEKADKLRYKVEDDVVKIFITPYKTSLSEKDLVFSQGDFNVEVVIALGIKDRSQLDAAITAHGRILHDATVISLNTGSDKSQNIGQINWQDATASSLSEMLVSISEAFGGGLIDNQIATAFLTGIVAETNRFANTKTSPKVMTMSAQLMAAGANQQLIVSKLEQPLPQLPQAEPPAPKKPEPEEVADDGTLSINHEIEAKLEESAKRKGEQTRESDEIHIDEQGNLKAVEGLIKPIEDEKKDDNSEDSGGPKTPLEAMAMPADNAAKESDAGEDKVKDEPDESEMPGSHTLLNPANKQPFLASPLTANTVPEWQDPYDSVPIDPLSGDGPGKEQIFEHKTVIKPPTQETAGPEVKSAPEVVQASSTPPAGNKPVTVDNARSAVEDALAAAPFDPSFHPEERLGAATIAEPTHRTDSGSQPKLSTPSDTPSLPLPGAGSNPPSQNNNNNSTPINQTAPPPIPPPLMPVPGIVIPTNTSSQS